MPKQKNSGSFTKGYKGGPGRPPGASNKINKELKQMILEALDQSGGVDYLVRQADKNPGPFLSLIGKVLPMTIAGDPNNPVEHKVLVKIVKPSNT